MSELDQTLRSRLHALARTESSELDAPVQTRIRANVRARLATRRPVLRRWLIAASTALALLGLSLSAWRELEQPAVVTPQIGPQRIVSSGAARSMVRTTPSCATDESASFVRDEQGEKLDLTRALVVARAGTTRVLELSSCSLRIELVQGRVAVHARKLAGGRLSVHTPLGDVQVRGTIFAVESDTKSGLIVSVAEGKVSVEQHGQESLLVGLNERLHIRHDGSISRAPLSSASRTQLLHTLGLTVERPQKHDAARNHEAVTAPAEVEADRVWHTGADLSPPGPEPGSPQEPDGRPMKKPHPKLEGVQP